MIQIPHPHTPYASLVVVQQFLIAYDLCLFIYEELWESNTCCRSMAEKYKVQQCAKKINFHGS